MAISTISNWVDSLANASDGRIRQIKKWYNLIRLENNLAQDNMESVISPDPRSSFNMATWLLTPQVWKVQFDTEGFTDEQMRKASGLERIIEREMLWQFRKGRGTLFGSAVVQMIKWALVTGWIAYATFPDEPHWTFNVFHPATVFPEYDSDGRLIAIARKYRLPVDTAKQLQLQQGWGPFLSTRSRPLVRSLWVRRAGEILHGVNIDNMDVRPLSPTGLPDFPINCFPVGGLPDDGSLMDNKWMEEIGQGLVAALMELQHNINKMQTYMQQILRDTANSMLVTRTQSGESPVTPETRFQRGPVYDLMIGEDLFFPAPPPLPPDMRTHSLDMRNQAQRNLFPDVSFGNFSQSVSVFLMTQATAGTQQVLNPFLTGIKDAVSRMIDFNIGFTRMRGGQLLGESLNGLPDDLLPEFRYDIVIPGDFINRVNSARMANPEFSLSQQTLVELLIPEVKNYVREEQQKSTDKVAKTAMFELLDGITKFREAAADAAAANDPELEEWATIAMNNLINQLKGTQGGAPEGMGAQFDDLQNLVGV